MLPHPGRPRTTYHTALAPRKYFVDTEAVGGIANPGVQRQRREGQSGRQFRQHHASRHRLGRLEAEVGAVNHAAHDGGVHLLVLSGGQWLSKGLALAVLGTAERERAARVGVGVGNARLAFLFQGASARQQTPSGTVCVGYTS